MPLNVQCKRCANLKDHWCNLVKDSPDEDMVRACHHYRTLTHADRVRAMSDEELAELLNPTASCTDCPVENRKPCGTDGRSCRDRVLDWLRQEAEE